MRLGGVAAVDGLSFRVAAGECVGFLGPNDPGKITTINILCGQAPLDGSVIWLHAGSGGRTGSS